MLMAAVAVLASSCSKDLTSDVDVNINGNEGVEAVGQSLTIVATVDDLTRVTVTGDKAAGTSKFNWEVGDELTVVYDGKTYTYLTTQAGRTSEFTVKEGSEAFLPTDLTKPVAVFYNVKSVDADAMTAVYDIAAEQVAGELTNKMPLYHYSANVVIEDQKLVATMQPLASVVEFELTASKSWNVDAISLSNSLLSKTYAVASGVVVDAATGAISLETAEVGTEVKVSMGAAADIATARNVQAVVMGLTREVTIKETITNEDQTTTEVEKTELYAPIYHDQAVLKTYKNGAENARRTIWAKYEAGATAVDEHKHIYQSVDVLKEKVADGISTAEQMKAFADAINGTTERYPAGAEFSNEDGVVVLKNNIDLSAYTNWIAIGCNNDDAQTVKPQFVGIFDGGNNTISGLTIDHNYDIHKVSFPNAEGELVPSYHNSCGLFGVVANGGVVKNLTVAGTIVANMTDPGNNWAYVGGVVAQISGGTVENCVSQVAISAGAQSSGKTRVGGVIGRVYASTADILVKDCKNQGAINLAHAEAKANQAVVGGVVGMIGDGSAGNTPTVTNCENSADVTVFNTGNNTYVGGVFGYITQSAEEAGVMSYCKNSGDVNVGSTESTCSALHFAGVVGRINYHTISYCENSGDVTLNEETNSPSTVSVGGVIGLTNGGASKTAYADNCVNKGSVTVQNVDTMAGGICVGGFIGYSRFCSKMTNCENQGAVYVDAAASNSQTFAGAFGGKIGVAGSGHDKGIVIENCVNNGTLTLYGSTVNTAWNYGGGIAGCCYGGTDVTADGVYGIYVTNCTNNGLVRLMGGNAKFRLGGMTGVNNCSAIEGCVNTGILAVEYESPKEQILGGIIGCIENQYSYVKNCSNSGSMCCLTKTARETGASTANTYVLLAGVVGTGGGAKALIENCTNTGKMLAAHDTLLELNEAKTAYVVNLDATTEYRAAIAGNPNRALPIKNCKAGGYIGTVKGGTGEDRYEADILHKLNDTEGDTYYWKYWLTGYTTPAVYSDMSFVDVE